MASKTITTKEQAQRVQEYIERVKGKDFLAPNYPLDKIAVYKFMSGSQDSGPRKTVGYFKGRFIDVVAEIVTMDEIGGWYLDPGDAAGNQNGGYIVAEAPPVAVSVPRVSGLVEYLGLEKRRAKQKAGLEKKLDTIDERLR